MNMRFVYTSDDVITQLNLQKKAEIEATNNILIVNTALPDYIFINEHRFN